MSPQEKAIISDTKNNNEIITTEEVSLKDAILLEGLPGVGNVGKLAAMHLIEELKAKKCLEIYSSHFPPQVLINEDGIVNLVNNTINVKVNFFSYFL